MGVNEFHQCFIGDDASNSMGKFMSTIGELDVDTCRWKRLQGPVDPAMSIEPTKRVIHYVHPVNAPMAPPKAGARKEQRLYQFGDAGMCLETCTIVEDVVPMADCFIVNDHLWVSKDEGGKGCTIAVTLQIKFVKSTMFRRIIENTVKKEFESFWCQYADLVTSLQGPSVVKDAILEDVANELEMATLMLEGEGAEVDLRSALRRIQTSSRRLSAIAAKRSSDDLQNTHLDAVEETVWCGVQKLRASALDCVQYIWKSLAAYDNSLALACLVILSMGMLNLAALKQITMMSRFLHDLDARLEKMIELNDLVLLKLA